ncbi:envelope stress response membrane protein PspC [Sphingorhabdus soli]|uniref:Envelope stress response membrane protein PspC n=1 Tax=Flavisphingopyxis soli TaxID=2601267 RepID=A0A5C6U869_9SPHN|nr:envelope stress response membrane protein PspC [Sphingorhabdus soli]TXC69019.1 envelope stress response membrane protein PspC [Sphingorhabdus soli]
MTSRRTKFYLDKPNGKIKGVCAGIADYTGVDVLWVRLAFLLLVFAGSGFPILAYIAIAMMAPKKPVDLYRTPEEAKFWQGIRSNPKRTKQEVRSKFRDLDRRLADIELFYTSSNRELSREIEELR